VDVWHADAAGGDGVQTPGWTMAAARMRATFDSAMPRAASVSGRCSPRTTRVELGRSHLDLAALAAAEGRGPGASFHARTARAMFTELGVPGWVERADAVALAGIARG
jgi:hypothetical protein